MGWVFAYEFESKRLKTIYIDDLKANRHGLTANIDFMRSLILSYKGKTKYLHQQ